jgi:gliding motility-associated-like protein
MKKCPGEYSLMPPLPNQGPVRLFFQGLCLLLSFALIQGVSAQCPSEIDILQPITCSGADDGVLTVAVPTGEDPDEVYWLFEDDTLFGVVQLGLGPGSYLAFVPGCSALGVTLNEPFPFFITSSIVQFPTCDNPCSGVIEATANFGTGDVTFDWSHNAAETSATGTGICEGVVLISALDANGCQDQDMVTVEIPPVEVLAFGTDPSCSGLEDGSVAAVASGGLGGGFSFVWTNSSGTIVGNTANISDLGTGEYFVTASDTGGCSMSTSVVLSDPPPVSIDMASTGVSCFGDEDGTASATFADAALYTWSGPNGFSSAGPEVGTIQDLAPGEYTVVVLATNGCIGAGSVDVEQPELLVGASFEAPPTCSGLSNGTAGIVPVGGTADYSVTWTLPSGDVATGEFLTGLSAGSYAFELQDANSCMSSGTVVLVDPEPVSLTLTLTSPLCAEGDLEGTGSVDAVAEGGLGPYLAGWFNVATQELIGSALSIGNLPSGTYGLGVSDQLGCTVDTVVTLLAPDSLSVSVLANPPSCFGDADGQAMAVVEGGTPEYSVLWTGDVDPTVGASIDNLTAGEYAVSVSDNLGCTAAVGFVLVDPEPIDFTAFATPVGCSGTDGAVLSTAMGGVPDYQVNWTGPDGDVGSGLELVGLTPGSYSAELTDLSGCEASLVVEVLALPALTLEWNGLAFDCTTGLAALSATSAGGDPPVVLSLEGPSGAVDSGDWASLSEGSYVLSATDQRGCIADTTFTVLPLISIEVDVTPAGCGGAGEIQVLALAGSGTYVFFEATQGPPTSSNGTLAIWEALEVGSYVIVVSDGVCQVEEEVLIEGATLFDWSVETFDFACDESPGSVSVSVEGALGPIEYSGESAEGSVSWSTADTSGLMPGQYTLSVLDGAGCERDTLIELLLAPPLSLVANATDIVCFGNTDGAIMAEAVGGTGILNLGAQGPQGLVLAPFENLIAGTYTVGVVDERGCSADTLIAIIEPPVIEVDVLVQPESCAGTMDGAVSLSASGGTGDLSVQWSNGPDTAEWLELAAGSYNWTVTDGQGCVSEGQADLDLAGGLTVTSEVEPGDCLEGVATANVVLHLVGNAAQANVLLGGLPADFTETLEGEGTWAWNNLPEGNYGWTASLGEGCGSNGTASVLLPDPLSWTGTVTPPFCEADTGQVVGLSVGGVLPIEAHWFGTTLSGDTLIGEGASIGPLPSGEYTIEIADDAGCIVDTTVSLVPLSTGLGVTLELIQPSCGGALVGQAELLPFGGVGPYEVQVEGAADDFSLPFLVPGSYPITLTDSLGCLAVDTILIDPASEFLLSAEVDSASCAYSEDGSVYLTTANGTGSVNFTFSGPFGAVSVGDTVQGVGPGVYEVTALDEAGCPAVLLVTVEAPPALFVTLDSLSRPSCLGDVDGALYASASGGTGSPAGWSFNWFFEGQQVGEGPTLDGLGDGDYAIVVLDGAGCTGEIESIPLVAQGDVALSVPSDTALCAGQVLFLEAVSSGATQTLWLLPDSTSGPGLDAPGFVVFEGSAQWVFTASRLGCVRSDTVQVTGLSLPVPNAGVDQTIPEGGTTSIGSEPNLDWSYVWAPSEEVLSPELGATATQGLFESTLFLLTAFTSEGCFSSDTVLIEVLKDLDIPSGFTPNADGINDRWNLGGLDQYPSAQITLFNRWGDVLLTQGADEGSWDGTLGGIPVPVGTYYYHIRVDEPALQAEWTGPITLMR